MRIVGGENKGYRFTPPKKTPARPTTDIAKEGLFNILNNRYYFEDVKFLDIFGGTGSISYEFASRGCKDITLVERDRGNILFIAEMAKKLDFPIQALKMDVFKFIKNCQTQYDLIFAGPPYPLKTLNTIPDKVIQQNMIAPEGRLIMEHNPNHNFEEHPQFVEKRNYGTTIFSFFSADTSLNKAETETSEAQGEGETK